VAERECLGKENRKEMQDTIAAMFNADKINY